MNSYDIAALRRALESDQNREANNRFVKDYLAAKGICEAIADPVSKNELCFWTEKELDDLFGDLHASPNEIRNRLKSFSIWPVRSPSGPEFISPTTEEIRLSAEFLSALCVNREGQFCINPEEGYAALSHVWSEGLGADDDNRGLHRSLLNQVFDKIKPLGIRWIWTDSLAIPGGKRSLTVVDEEIKSMLINAMAEIYRNARQVIILDAMVLRLNSTDPVKVAAILSCGSWMTRVWTYQEIKLAVNSVVVTKNGFVDFRSLVASLKAQAQREAGERYLTDAPGRYPSLARTFGRLERNDELGVSLPDIAIGCGYREATERLDFARAMFPTLQIQWNINESLETAMQKVYESQKRHATRLALFHGPPRASNPGWAPAVFPGLVDSKIIEPGIWKRRGMSRSWLTSKIKSIVPSKPGCIILELDNGKTPGAYTVGFVSVQTQKESPKSMDEFKQAVKDGTAYLLADEPLVPKRHFSRVGLLVERFTKPKDLEAWVCMTFAIGETEESYVAESQTWLLLHENPVSDDQMNGKGVSELNLLYESSPKAEPSNFADLPLHAAAKAGDSRELRRQLLRVHPTSTDMRGWTALHVAAATGHTHIITDLLKAGAELEVFTRNGESLLSLAIDNDQMDTLRALIQAGANINASHRDGFSPLVLATLRGDLEAVNILLAEGADPSSRDAGGWLPLIFAASKNDILDALLEKRADPRVLAPSGVSALDAAVRAGNAYAVKKLVAHHADPNDMTTMLPPLYHAIDSGNTDTVRILLEVGARVTVRFKDGWTPLMLAAKVGNIDVGRLLLEKDKPALDQVGGADGQTALHVAAVHASNLFFKWLCESGASRRIKDKQGKLADDLKKS